MIPRPISVWSFTDPDAGGGAGTVTRSGNRRRKEWHRSWTAMILGFLTGAFNGIR